MTAPGLDVPLRDDDFRPTDRETIAALGGGVAAVIADIAHHHIGDLGAWDLYGDTAAELRRLTDVVDQLGAAARYARARITHMRRLAQFQASQRSGGAGS